MRSGDFDDYGLYRIRGRDRGRGQNRGHGNGDWNPLLFGITFVPLIGIVPSYATAPALIMVGFFMIKEIVNINFEATEEGFPAYIIIIMIALTYSISSGLALGFVSFTLLMIISGKIKEIKPAMWAIALLSLLFFLI